MLSWHRTALSIIGVSAALSRLAFDRIGLWALASVLVAGPAGLWAFWTSGKRCGHELKVAVPIVLSLAIVVIGLTSLASIVS